MTWLRIVHCVLLRGYITKRYNIFIILFGLVFRVRVTSYYLLLHDVIFIVMKTHKTTTTIKMCTNTFLRVQKRFSQTI